MGEIIRKQMLKKRNQEVYENMFLRIADIFPYIEKFTEETGKELLNKINKEIELTAIENPEIIINDIVKEEFKEVVFNKLTSGILQEAIKANK